MEISQLKNGSEHDLKRRRTDSGYGELSQPSRTSTPGIKRQDTQGSSGKRACSPILLSDDHEPDFVITEEKKLNLAEPNITLYLGTDRQDIPQSKFLQHIWKYGLDSPCMVCHGEFVKDGSNPPIRTFTFEQSEDLSGSTPDITQVPVAPHPIRIFNRHMACIKARRLPYIPISHVWHQSVSTAQLGLVLDDMEAARVAYQVPIQTLLALTKKFGAVEVWHDYFSVPQWRRDVQQQLLLHIPTIFAYPSRMVMHLDDVQLHHLRNVQDPQNYTCFIEAVSKLTESRWFERMWVALEYIQSQDVTILCQYYEILETSATDLSEIAGVNIGKYVKRLGQDRFNQIAGSKGFSWERRASWDDMETWKKLDPNYRTLGSAIFIIGQKKCREHHDYFFAIRGLLNLGHNTSEVHTILAGNVFESCLDLNWDALVNGDYSPLLFVPLENELEDPRAAWLRGHTVMSQKLWDFGTCRQPPKHRTIIRGDVIEPNLESIGVVESFEYCYFVGSPENIFQRVCLKLLQIYGPSAKQVCEALDRVFPSVKDKGLFLLAEPISSSLKDVIEVRDYDQIATILERYNSISFKGDNQPELLGLSKKLISLLRFGLPEKLSHISRIKAATDEAQFYGKDREGLASVRCKSCSVISVLRVTAWENLSPLKTELYRIPGLLYDDTVQDGVGLAVANGKVVGKMAYATPSCECRTMELVALGKRSLLDE